MLLNLFVCTEHRHARAQFRLPVLHLANWVSPILVSVDSVFRNESLVLLDNPANTGRDCERRPVFSRGRVFHPSQVLPLSATPAAPTYNI